MCVDTDPKNSKLVIVAEKKEDDKGVVKRQPNKSCFFAAAENTSGIGTAVAGHPVIDVPKAHENFTKTTEKKNVISKTLQRSLASEPDLGKNAASLGNNLLGGGNARRAWFREISTEDQVEPSSVKLGKYNLPPTKKMNSTDFVSIFSDIYFFLYL